MKIKTNQVLYDLSGDNPGFVVPAGTILEVTSTEDEYWVVEYEGQAFPVMFGEADIQEGQHATGAKQ